MPLPRYAGGHDKQMRNLLKGASVVAHENWGEYEGDVYACVQLDDWRFAIYHDDYGSCSGCDSWEGAGDDEVVYMCINLANSALVFDTLENLKKFLANPEQEHLADYSVWKRDICNSFLKSIKEIYD